MQQFNDWLKRLEQVANQQASLQENLFYDLNRRPVLVVSL